MKTLLQYRLYAKSNKDIQKITIITRPTSWLADSMYVCVCVSCFFCSPSCHMSRVTLKKYEYIYFYFIFKKIYLKVVELVGGGSVVNKATPSSLVRAISSVSI